ncbi:ABC transporter substrate-binding protein [Paenibacillus humicola]|uniref:ABC transporter substrate-binding protein n=1 Tax=Paenibacillus humicola TaxID=3110540 RepID=UPI00237AE7BD|nr:ABC transporter substrate-binding protein [Paenibacillus humicola]
MGYGKKWIPALLSLLLAGVLLIGCSKGTDNGANGSSSTQPPANATTGDTSGQTGSGDQTAQTAGQPKDGGTLTYGSFTDIVSVNPLYIQDTGSGDAAYFLYANLYDLDRQGNVVAEPWSLASDKMQVSDDGKTYTVKLKPNAKWSDGQPVTADDVIFTLNTIRNPEAGSPGISQFDKIDTITKVDDHTVQIKLKQVYAPFQYALVSSIVPYHVLKDIAPKDLQNNAFGKDPSKTVTDGPWKWTKWEQKQYLTFDADPNYWGPKPHIQQIVYKIYADQNTEIQALLKGDIDVTAAIPVTQVDAVKNKKGFNVISAPGPQYEYLAFNFDPKNFKDNYSPFTGEKTRQAIAYAINRQGMVDNVLKGTGKLINAPFLPGTWADPGDAAVNYAYDPDQAKKLLAEDGWKPGSDGILVKDGHRFSFELQYNAGNSRREQVAAIIQQNLKDVGIEVTPKGIDFSSWVDQNVNPGKFPAILLAWVLNTPDPDGESTFSSKYYPPTGQNVGWYKDEKLDQLWVQGYSTTDQAKRKQIYSEVAKEITTNLPYVFLYQYGTPEGLTSRVHYADADRPEPSLSYGYLYHVNNWWVD